MIVIEKNMSVEAIYAEADRIHRSGDFYETNFFARESLENWIVWDQLEVVRTEHVLLLLRKSKYSRQVYYFTNDLECLVKVLAELTGLLDRLNIDYLGKEDARKEIFERAGFNHYITLHRLIGIRMNGTDQSLGYGEYAVKEDAGQICDILEKTMDLKADQVPGIQEIENHIARKEALVSRDENTQEIVSCILWVRKGKGMIGQYWASNPKYKGALDSLWLWDAYLKINGSVRRTILFVREGNPTRKIYERSGFRHDGLNDYVYCYRKS